MKKIILFMLIAMTMVTIAGCQKKAPEGTIGFYITKGQDLDNPIAENNYKLLFKDSDIKEYKWKTHEITFTEEFFNTIKGDLSDYDPGSKESIENGGSPLLGATQRDKFVVMIDDEKIYEGYFKQSAISSFCPLGAVISDTSDGIRIDFQGVKGVDEDVRDDARIKVILKDKGLLY